MVDVSYARSQMEILETRRLLIRQFVMEDLAGIHGVLSAAFKTDATVDDLIPWLRWSVMNYDQLSRLRQPPYGDRAVVLKESGQVIGSVGFVPCLMPFGQLPYFAARGFMPRSSSTEFGLFWAVDPEHQRRGYATEAARAMIDAAFKRLRLGRIVATTDYDNIASQGVMRNLDMRIERNPMAEPEWMQVVGILENTPA
jgi:ribosomal-protein-alanine N-acetyltransferase